MAKFDPPRIAVDFNEMVDADVVLLSREDAKSDSSGSVVSFTEGQRVYLYMDDADESGALSALLATGIAEINVSDGWSSSIRWVCRIERWE